MLGELLVAKFSGGLFGFLPMCDSNGEVFVIRSVFILSAKSESNLYGVLFLSILNDPNLCFSVWIICSTTPISVLSFTGANISLMSIVLHNCCSFWATNVCALSHPKLRGTPLFELYRFPKFMAMSAVLFEKGFAIRNFDYSIIATKMYASLISSLGIGPAKSNRTSPFDSTTGSIWNDCYFKIIALKFLPCSVQCLKLCAIWTKERYMCGRNTCWQSFNMAADPDCVKCMLSNTVGRSLVRTNSLSSNSRQSSRICSRFLRLSQYWSSISFLEKLRSGRMFGPFFGAAAMNFTQRTFYSFQRKSGVSSSILVFVLSSIVASIPIVIRLRLVSNCVCCVFVMVRASRFRMSSSWLHCIGSTRLTQYSYVSFTSAESSFYVDTGVVRSLICKDYVALFLFIDIDWVSVSCELSLKTIFGKNESFVRLVCD